MVGVVKIVNGVEEWTKPVSDGAIEPREMRIYNGLQRAWTFLEGIKTGAEAVGCFVGGDTQYCTWLKLGDAEYRIRETFPDGSTRWKDGRP